MRSYPLFVLVGDVLVEVVQCFQGGDGVGSDAVRHGAQDVAQVLVLLQQSLQLLHPPSLLLYQGLHLCADVLLLLEHADASLFLNMQTNLTAKSFLFFFFKVTKLSLKTSAGNYSD